MKFHMTSDKDRWVRLTDLRQFPVSERPQEYAVPKKGKAACGDKDHNCLEMIINGRSERVDDFGRIRLKIGDSAGGPYRTSREIDVRVDSTLNLADHDTGPTPQPLPQAAKGGGTPGTA